MPSLDVPPILKGGAETAEFTKHPICFSMFSLPVQVGEPRDLANWICQSISSQYMTPRLDLHLLQQPRKPSAHLVQWNSSIASVILDL